MMKIGAFARACGVNMQTLRYYDSIGLFPADRVDSDSGYRYYKPERVRDFQMITELKGLGFSLEEIKHFLFSEEEMRQFMLSEKRKALQERIETEKARIRQIDAQGMESDSARHPRHSFLNIPFEDDPSVIGQWILCGALPQNSSFAGEEALHPCDSLLKRLYFLPGGGHVWSYFWSRGILYRLCGAKDTQCIASPYHTFEYDGKHYLSLAHPEEKHRHIYRQKDNIIYTENQAYIYKDEVDLPFVPDKRLLGAWDTVDVLSHPNDFSVLPKKNTDSFFIREITFYERGMCRRLLKSGHPQFCSYTKGLILDRERSFAEHYELYTVKDEEYLIVEHKSGDYAYLGKIFCYYTFKKRKGTTK